MILPAYPVNWWGCDRCNRQSLTLFGGQIAKTMKIDEFGIARRGVNTDSRIVRFGSGLDQRRSWFALKQNTEKLTTNEVTVTNKVVS
jgi:hypothetical protein